MTRPPLFVQHEYKLKMGAAATHVYSSLKYKKVCEVLLYMSGYMQLYALYKDCLVWGC